MTARRILGGLLLALASVLAFAQICLVLSAPGHPTFSDFLSGYLFEASVENLGVAVPAAVTGFFLLRGGARFWMWTAFTVSGIGLWLFVVRELWLHYYELPHEFPNISGVHGPYFRGPLWWALVRLSWHIMFPISFILAGILCLNSAQRPGDARFARRAARESDG